ncbi:SWIM zinc finger family protein [Acuticoccus sediminis]|uniref:SWIM zinc finger family protein n=1 Tax=Acuticoccus sediminis TaxID=2184697 RepID=UPI001CFEC7F1|nr:SWIM zinc finger family protein [Acuticoccus sediminis]
MLLTHDAIASLAPDQKALTAARGQMKPAKWPVRERADDRALVWGECQGSGANPYRTVVDAATLGYKCTCPSRKFPCKHVLALMWMFVDDPALFQPAVTPEWVAEWLGRRRRAGPAAITSGGGKSLAAASLVPDAAAADPKAEARRIAAAEKRAGETRAALFQAIDDVEGWIADQLRTGLGAFIEDAPDRCRAIAARMVDGKAAALAGRIDEIPARLLLRPVEERLDAAVAELGKVVILARAFRAAPEDPELRRLVATAETRESVLEAAGTLRVRAAWEVLGERISTRRDGMVMQESWLINLGEGPRFAVLLDFFPASAGRRGSAFANGDRFEGELAFYPARVPLRALIADRTPLAGDADWPATPAAPDPLAAVAAANDAAPWLTRVPLLLPPGRLLAGGKAFWWQSADGGDALPLADPPPRAVRGMALAAAAGVWDAGRLTLLAAQTDWGRIALDG